MKILFIRTQNPFFESGAGANRSAGLLKGLAERGVEVTLLVTQGYISLQELKQAGIPKDIKNIKVQYTVKVINNNISFRRFNQLVLGKLLALINSFYIKKYFNKSFDYIWISEENSIMELFSKNFQYKKVPTLIEINEFHDVLTGSSMKKKGIFTKDREMVFCNAIKKIDNFIIMTNTLLEHYKKMAKPDARFIHIPMTVDLDRFQSVSEIMGYNKPYIAYTGTFNNAKDGIDILIKSFARIAAKYPQYHLYLAGFWHYDVPMQKKLIEDMGLSDRVTYLGVLNKDQIPIFISNADLLCLSRPDSHQAQGGFPTKLGEYLAAGKPVCVTTVGEIPNYLEDNVSAFFATPGDVDSFFEAMDRALKDVENAKVVALRGKKVAETEFNLDIQSNRLFDFLFG